MLYVPFNMGAFLSDLLAIADILQQSAKGRILVVRGEEDDSSNNSGANTFLKLDGTRLGRDLEEYAFMGETYGAGKVMAELAAIGMVLAVTGLNPSLDKARDRFRDLAGYLHTTDQRSRWLHIWREKGFDEFQNITRDIVPGEKLGHTGFRPGDIMR